MIRLKSLFGCLAIFGMLATTVVSIEAGSKRECRRARRCQPSCAPQHAFAAPASGSICLQSLLYADSDIEMWLADEYDGSPCTGNNSQIYVFTELGSTAPQSCGALGPSCMGYATGEGFRDSRPQMNVPLIGIESHIDRLRNITKRVPGLNYPNNSGGSSTPIEWDPTEALTLVGNPVRVKVRSADSNGWVVLRLLKGKADLHDVTALRPRRPSRPLDFKIGLENAMPGPGNPRPVTAVEWPKYPGSNTAFKIEWPENSGIYYHCLTTNPVHIGP